MKQKLNIPAVFASSLGNVIEWYDFGLYSAFATIFAQLFFPSTSPAIATLKVFAVFATGFLFRPVGGFLFGHFGDRLGRAITLQASILLIGVPTVLMAFLPTYQQVGIYAPLLMVSLRILQGISLGGEFAGSIIYLTEIAPADRRAFLASFAGTAANIGLLAASGISLVLQACLSAQHYISFGWRLALLLGGLMSMAILYLRRSFVETPNFKAIAQNHQIVRAPFLTALKNIPLVLLRTIGLVMFGAVLYYICFIYLQDYLITEVHLPRATVAKIQFICMLVMLLLVPCCGMVCDKLGRRKTFIFMTTSVIIVVLPCFYLLTSGHLIGVIVAMAIFTLLSSLEQGTTSATVVEQYPTSLRYSGVAVSYNVTQAIFGGTAPLVAAFLTLHTASKIAPAYYLIVIAAITLLTVLIGLRKNN